MRWHPLLLEGLKIERHWKMKLHSLSASQLLTGYARREFSPVEVIRDCAVRIEALNPSINAFTSMSFDSAEQEARESERRMALGNMRPLEGVPVAIKDLIDTACLRTTYGSAIFADHIPQADAEVVRLLKQAGAIVVGKTATHEFAWGFTTDNPHWGVTRNPWDLTRIPGGSSGGSAAAVAAELVPVAIGTDTGGSIRVPSSFCGVAGLKPSFGFISTQGVFPLAPSLDHVGPICLDPVDLSLVLRVLLDAPMKPDARVPFAGTTPPAGLVGVRFAVETPSSCFPPDPGVQSVWKAAIQALREAGAIVVEETIAGELDVSAIFASIQLAEALHTHRRMHLYPDHAGAYGDDVLMRLRKAEGVTLANYLDACIERQHLQQSFEKLLGKVDAVVSLCAATSAPAIESLRGSRPTTDLRSTLLGYTAPQNLTGLPACAVRAGFDNNDMPVGIQFTGARGAEQRVLELAEAFCRILPDVQARRPDLLSGGIPL